MAWNWFKKNKETTESEQGKTEESKAESEIKPASPSSPPVKSRENETEPAGLVERLRKGLSKTRQILNTDIDKLFVIKRKVDDSLLEELEEVLITSDIGVQTATELIKRISTQSSKITDADQLKEILKAEIRSLMITPAKQRDITAKPHIIMVAGVNGVGKTTTIGKLAARFKSEGKNVLIVAADTFRAAAIEQLTIWAERAGADIVKHKDNADPSAVVFDGIEAAISRDKDIVIVDTAGRLHTKVNLMEELKKVKRTISRKIPEAPHETLLILDATTGQNAISQVRLFHEAIGVTDIALTKLDGTAKGGIVVSICSAFNIPLKYIGVGESIDDLQDFNPDKFVDALF